MSHVKIRPLWIFSPTRFNELPLRSEVLANASRRPRPCSTRRVRELLRNYAEVRHPLRGPPRLTDDQLRAAIDKRLRFLSFNDLRQALSTLAELR
jgi:hypothetical protein